MMGFEYSGLQPWEIKPKYGRKLLFDDPAKLWEVACDYFEWVRQNPLKSIEYNGKDAKKCIVPRMRAMSWEALAIHCDCSRAYFHVFEKNLQEDNVQVSDEMKEAFLSVLARIRQVIHNQKFEGAAAGFLNPMIIARDLGLTDKSEVKQDNTHKVDGPVEVLVRESGVPLAGSENEVDTTR